MKILLTGTSGLVGNAFAFEAAQRGHEVIGLYRNNRVTLQPPSRAMALDLTSPDAVQRLVLDIFPDAIVNCAAVSSPADVDHDPAHAKALNVVLPARLAELANHISSRFLHLSTDMVFDGFKGDYLASDAPAPGNRYGEQKLEAENAVLQAAAPFSIVLRIPIVTGNSPGGKRSVHEKLLGMFAEGKKAHLFTDELRQPCSNTNIASAMVELLERQNLSGIFHWAGADQLSRYQMGEAICCHFGLDPEYWLEKASLAGTGRPADLTLNCSTLAGKLKNRPATYAQQVDALYCPAHLRDWYDSVVPRNQQPIRRFLS